MPRDQSKCRSASGTRSRYYWLVLPMHLPCVDKMIAARMQRLFCHDRERTVRYSAWMRAAMRSRRFKSWQCWRAVPTSQSCFCTAAHQVSRRPWRAPGGSGTRLVLLTKRQGGDSQSLIRPTGLKRNDCCP